MKDLFLKGLHTMNRICDNAKTLISKFGQDVKVQCTSEKTIKTKGPPLPRGAVYSGYEAYYFMTF